MPSDAIEHSEQGGADRTVLFVDIADSTPLLFEHGDERGRQIVLTFTDMLGGLVRENGGTVVERIGDEVLCLFDSPDAAGQTAGMMHLRVVSTSVELALRRPLRVRVGFEHGPMIRTPEGVFGATVHTAARLVSLAKAGQTLTTSETLDGMHPMARRLSRFFDRVVFKGFQCEREVCEIVWDSGVTVMASDFLPKRSAAENLMMEIWKDDRAWRLDAQNPRLDLGRHPTCTIQVSAPSVSKLHARLSWDRGKIRVEDMSTNGTYVHREGEKPVFLHHEGMGLSGSGIMTLGSPSLGTPALAVIFRCSPVKE